MFCHKLSRKTVWRLYSRCKEKTPTGSHRGIKTCRIDPTWQGLPVLKVVHSRFVTNLTGKLFDDSVPNVWKRHQLSHTPAKNMSYTPILARAVSSESNTFTFCHKLSRKIFWRLCSRCMEKTPTGSHSGGKRVVHTHPGEGFQFWKQYTHVLSQT